MIEPLRYRLDKGVTYYGLVDFPIFDLSQMLQDPRTVGLLQLAAQNDEKRGFRISSKEPS